MRSRIQLAPLLFLLPGLTLAGACSSSNVPRPREVLQKIWDKAHPELKLPTDVQWPWKSSATTPADPSQKAPAAPAPTQTADGKAPTAAVAPAAPAPPEAPTILRGTITSRRGSVAVLADSAGGFEVVQPGDPLNSSHWRVQRIEAESAVLVSASDRALTRRIFLAPLDSLPSHH